MKLLQRIARSDSPRSDLVDRLVELETQVALWKSDGGALAEDVKALKSVTQQSLLRVERVDKALDKIVEALNAFALNEWQLKEALKVQLMNQYSAFYFTKE